MPPEALGEAFGVAMIAAPRDLGAAGHGIPGGIRPFDCRFIAHGNTSARNASRISSEDTLSCKRLLTAAAAQNHLDAGLSS